MPRSSLTSDDCIRVLVGEQLVRVAFRDQDVLYLIPLGYAWLRSALYGVAEPGRKTEIAERNPAVAFQVDTAMQTGLWESHRPERRPPGAVLAQGQAGVQYRLGNR